MAVMIYIGNKRIMTGFQNNIFCTLVLDLSNKFNFCSFYSQKSKINLLMTSRSQELFNHAFTCDQGLLIPSFIIPQGAITYISACAGNNGNYSEYFFTKPYNKTRLPYFSATLSTSSGNSSKQDTKPPEHQGNSNK